MGYAYLAKCKKCGHKFMVNTGPSFTALMLHCDKCGREKQVSLIKIHNFIEKHKEEGGKNSVTRKSQKK